MLRLSTSNVAYRALLLTWQIVRKLRSNAGTGKKLDFFDALRTAPPDAHFFFASRTARLYLRLGEAHMVLVLLATSFLGCRSKDPDLDWETGNLPEEDTASVDSADTADEEDDHTCDEVSLDLLGPEEPVVGDTWVIWMNCDESRLIGPMVVHFEPTDFATLEDNVAVFLYAGQAELSVRSGTYDLSTTVTVTE